jgi:hypothetical protein
METQSSSAEATGVPGLALRRPIAAFVVLTFALSSGCSGT